MSERTVTVKEMAKEPYPYARTIYRHQDEDGWRRQQAARAEYWRKRPKEDWVPKREDRYRYW